MVFYNETGKSRRTVTIVTPLAAGETLWREMLPSVVDAADEILFAAAAPPPEDWADVKPPGARWLHCAKSGRAAQMNEAAAAAAGEMLWFVHADSCLPPCAAECLQKSIARAAKKNAAENTLHYFDLRFYDGGAKMRVNEFGVRLRCALFGNPFGDQAIALPRRLFFALGGFCEGAAYGEDHLLVLAAKRGGANLRRAGAAVGTSARRYEREGWWRTVALFQKLWWRQWRRQQ